MILTCDLQPNYGSNISGYFPYLQCRTEAQLVSYFDRSHSGNPNCMAIDDCIVVTQSTVDLHIHTALLHFLKFLLLGMFNKMRI